MLRKQEQLVFESFLRVAPKFANRPIARWGPGSNPPDILCFDESGARIGVELAEWLDEQQIKSSVEIDRLEASYLGAIRSEAITAPEGVRFVFLTTKIGRRLLPDDCAEFKTEVLGLTGKATAPASWCDGPQGLGISNFCNYPCLADHLQAIHIYPGERAPFGFAWVRFPTKGGAYSPRSIVDALRRILEKKTGTKYVGLHQSENLNDFCLIIYYNLALIHNTPFLAPGFGFREVAAVATSFVQSDHGAFDRIVLFNAIEQDLEAIQIWP